MEYALNLIHTHQHPLDCTSADYLVWKPVHRGHGIGEAFLATDDRERTSNTIIEVNVVNMFS